MSGTWVMRFRKLSFLCPLAFVNLGSVACANTSANRKQTSRPRRRQFLDPRNVLIPDFEEAKTSARSLLPIEGDFYFVHSITLMKRVVKEETIVLSEIWVKPLQFRVCPIILMRQYCVRPGMTLARSTDCGYEALYSSTIRLRQIWGKVYIEK